MKKSWKVVNHHFKVSLLFAQAKQAMRHWSGHHFNPILLVGHFHQRLLMSEISEKLYFRKLVVLGAFKMKFRYLESLFL